MDYIALHDSLESSVRGYSRQTRVMFSRAANHRLWDTTGAEYIDFLMGSGSLNYGHNDPDMKAALLEYIAGDGIALGLDFYFEAKTRFFEAFRDIVLRPRALDYKLQCVGPTGTNAVEAALKLARKVTGRSHVVTFTNAFHGCTLGALSVTGNRNYRHAFQGELGHAYRAAYDGYHDGLDSADLLERMMSDASSGFDNVAAIILEGVQGEGGFNVASPQWAQKIAALARAHGALLIVDEIQTGCGRTGTFFSFESLGIQPDIVTLAKSLSGFGLPLAMVLMRRELDQWEPGEHTGTFRGNAHAFLTGTVALQKFWRDTQLADRVRANETKIARHLSALTERHACIRKGRGMMQGLQFRDDGVAGRVQSLALAHGLLIERCGPGNNVVKLLPPLTIPDDALERGLHIVGAAVEEACAARAPLDTVES
ncbi:diaminobutyrate--2-oxoglutarate transaminase [Burkholderia alba]|uniref:diaminobutyrate--2-oxoglutarate transaminase n=1 Tax=Burkholderia alba TaxID=2683677 RepID=UPI002B05A95A|nr:diaminobutyrate--2-oxoglutarate transaminase [Burkholderia alba]